MLAGVVDRVMTTILGIVMALRFGRNKRLVIACMVAGVVIPMGMLIIFK